MKKFIIYTSEITSDNIAEIAKLNPDVSNEEIYDIAVENNSMFFRDEVDNLDIELPNNIIAIASIGRWNGRKSGYRELGNNLKEVLTECNTDGDNIECYYDGKDVCKTVSHHDGTNNIRFRMWKENISDNMREQVKNLIYQDNPIAEKYIKRYTKSLKHYVISYIS